MSGARAQRVLSTVVLAALAAAAHGGGGVVDFCRSPGMAIPDVTPPGGVTDVQAIDAGNAILDLDVALVAPHTWVGDLGFALDDGTRTTVLIDRPGHPATAFGCSRDDIDAVLDDEAVDPAEDACAFEPPALGGPLVSNGDLGVFDGAPIAATWTLTVFDAVSGDVGTLESWCLRATLDAMPFGDGFESEDFGAWSSAVP